MSITTEKSTNDIDVSVLEFQLSRVIKHIVQREPFFGMFAVTLSKQWSKQVPTAGVGLQGINYILLINPDYFNSLSFEHKQGLIIHELNHLSHFHLTDFTHLKDKKRANIAMDLEINQVIDKDKLPPGGLMWDKMDAKYNLKAKEGTNTYYKKLQDDEDPEQSNGNKIKNHQHYWPDPKDADPNVQTMAEQQLVETIRRVCDNIKDRGLIPAHVEEMLSKKKIEPPKFNWKAYLRRFIGEGVSSYDVKTMRKRSKRFDFMKGNKRVELSRILLAIDTSYSVSDEEIKEFFNEIDNMTKTGHVFDILFFSTFNDDIFTYKKGMEVITKARGGTDFQAPLTYWHENKKKYSTLICLTDGEAPAPDNPERKMLWVLSSRSKMCDHLVGKTIKLEIDKK